MDTQNALFKQIVPAHEVPHGKVTIVGCGQVGMACAFAMMTQEVVSEICLVDVAADKLKGEMLDLQHGTSFLRRVRVNASTDYSITTGSKVCFITAGARQREGESRLSLVQRNVDILKGVVGRLVQYSPNTILCVISNPVDVLTYVCWKLSGLPKERVFGSGTNLDSARFRFLMSERLNIAPSSCHGWIIGEHGDSSVALWSGVNIAGVQLQKVNPKLGTPDDPENWNDLHKKVVESAYEIIKLKGYTSWAIGMSCAAICRAIVRNSRNLHALSINVNGLHGIDKDVYLSLPVVLGENGVTHIVKQHLNEAEQAKLSNSAVTLFEVQQGLQL